MLLGVSILGLAAAAALQGVRAILEFQIVQAASNDMLSALYVARAEAINQRTTVTVCPSADGNTCISNATARDWQHGWVVRTADRVLTANRDVKPVLRFAGIDNVASIRYEYTGTASMGHTSALNLCVDNAAEGRQIKISATGRPYAHAVSCRTAV